MNLDVWEVLVDEGWIKALAAGKVKIEEVKHRAEFLERALIDVSKPKAAYGGVDPAGGDGHTGFVTGVGPQRSISIPAPTAKHMSMLFQQVFAPSFLRAYDEPNEHPDPPDLPVTKSETPVVGFRRWKVVYPSKDRVDAWRYEDMGLFTEIRSAGGGLSPGLVSPVTGHTWDGPIMRADGPPAPYDPHDYRWQDRDDHCYGIYAHTGPDWRGFNYASPAMGKVEGWGRVVVHDRGWRAESVRIVSLLMHPSVDRATATAIADRYQCDVTFDPTSWKEA